MQKHITLSLSNDEQYFVLHEAIDASASNQERLKRLVITEHSDLNDEQSFFEDSHDIIFLKSLMSRCYFELSCSIIR